MINHRMIKMSFGLTSSILVILLFKFFTHGLPVQEELYEGSTCKLENGKTGVCKKIYDCPSRLQEVKEGRRSSDSTGRCGFQDFTEIVCCSFNITEKIGLRPAEIACRQYENEIGTDSKMQEVDDDDDDDTRGVQYNIYSGTLSESGEFPYMVALGYENEDKDDDDDSDAIKYTCGGTLISSRYVLTAAHCVNNVQEKVPIEVRVGSEDLRNVGDAQRIRISNIITHPQYKRSVNYNDVAILKLSTPVRVASNVRPICIQTKSLDTMNIQSNTKFIVIGWGATDLGEEGSTKLMKTPGLRLIDRESCAKSFTGFGKLPRGLENMLCALDTNVTRRADTCHGDSGGPLLMLVGSSHSIIGVTAFGQSCGGSTPGVYTAIYSYLEWIEEEVWPEMIDE